MSLIDRLPPNPRMQQTGRGVPGSAGALTSDGERGTQVGVGTGMRARS
jgi:hypothetical protein